MKKLIILICCLIATLSSYAQTNNINLDNLEYIEIRTTPFNGWQFKTSPKAPFQGMGLMKYRLRSYLKENEESMQYFRKHNWAMVGMTASSLVSGFGLIVIGGTLGFSPSVDLAPIVVAGSIIALGYGATFWLNNLMYKHLQKAVDIYNQSKNPTLSAIQPFIPRVQASSHSLGFGLVWSI